MQLDALRVDNQRLVAENTKLKSSTGVEIESSIAEEHHALLEEYEKLKTLYDSQQAAGQNQVGNTVNPTVELEERLQDEVSARIELEEEVKSLTQELDEARKTISKLSDQKERAT